MALTLGDLSRPAGAVHRPKRVGRGSSSGHGKTSGRGSKGQKSRSGERKNPGFEGGQTPLYRRLPKRGFTNKFRHTFQVVNLDRLNRFSDGAVVTSQELKEEGLVRDAGAPVKVLGDGELTRRLTVRAQRFSQRASQEIARLGGQAELVGQ